MKKLFFVFILVSLVSCGSVDMQGMQSNQAAANKEIDKTLPSISHVPSMENYKFTRNDIVIDLAIPKGFILDKTVNTKSYTLVQFIPAGYSELLYLYLIDENNSAQLLPRPVGEKNQIDSSMINIFSISNFNFELDGKSLLFTNSIRDFEGQGVKYQDNIYYPDTKTYTRTLKN